MGLLTISNRRFLRDLFSDLCKNEVLHSTDGFYFAFDLPLFFNPRRGGRYQHSLSLLIGVLLQCLMIGDKVKSNLSLQQTRRPALSTPNESFWFEPFVDVDVSQSAFLFFSFFCLKSFYSHSASLSPPRPWFFRSVGNAIHY